MLKHCFDNIKIGKLNLKNRIVRSATYEGAADLNGYPSKEYSNLYRNLAKNEIGMIITGFAFVSKEGRAMQPAQAGIDSSKKIEVYRKITNLVHQYNTPIILQLAHTGRQTRKEITGSIPVSSTNKKSIYFDQKVKYANYDDIKEIITHFINSAHYAQESGFDGVQIHAAHGYLLNQFLLPETNNLKNEYGIDKETGLGTKIIEEIFHGIKYKCGIDFPILFKISAGHDLSKNFTLDKFDSLITFLDKIKADAIEISYGTMDYPLNIFRGSINLKTVFKYNPIFKNQTKTKQLFSKLFIKNFMLPKFKNYSPFYNIYYAERAKQLTNIPIISVGGFRSLKQINNVISNNMTDLISMSRPFIAENDLVLKMKHSESNYVSKCKNCNECVFMCDSGNITKCYSQSEY